MTEAVSVPAVANKGPTFEEIVRALGQVFNNSFLYGANHGVTKKAMEDGYKILTSVFEQQKELLFNVTEEGLLVNGAVVDQKNPLVRTFIAHLGKLEIKSFGLEKGMPRDKFDQLIEIMNTKPDILQKSGGFTAVVASQKLQGVRVSKVTYVQVAEDELVVSKKDLEAATASVGTGSKTVGAIDGVFAFLKGEVAADDEKAAANVRELASHSEDRRRRPALCEGSQEHCGHAWHGRHGRHGRHAKRRTCFGSHCGQYKEDLRLIDEGSGCQNAERKKEIEKEWSFSKSGCSPGCTGWPEKLTRPA